MKVAARSAWATIWRRTARPTGSGSRTHPNVGAVRFEGHHRHEVHRGRVSALPCVCRQPLARAIGRTWARRPIERRDVRAIHHRAVPTVIPILASIPSPSDNAIKIGGLELRAYGLAIALGVIAAVWIARRRWAARGGDPDDISRIALWAVLAGLIGLASTVLTDLDRFEGRWLHVFAVWEGGLGIPGGLIAGVGTGAFVAHRRGLPVAQLLDVVAPTLPRRPGDRAAGQLVQPGAVRSAHRPALGTGDRPCARRAALNVATFHPTFLYEALWNLALAGGLVLWERHHPNSRPGRLFVLRRGLRRGARLGRALRIDPAAHLFGVRWNIWMSCIAFVGAVGWLVFDSWQARQKAGEPTEAAAEPADTEEPRGRGGIGRGPATETSRRVRRQRDK